MERWLYNPSWFGKSTNWTQKKVFPQKGKYAMVFVMSNTGIYLVFYRQYESSVMVRCVYGTGGCMGMAFSLAQLKNIPRIKEGKKIWLVKIVDLFW